MHRPFRRVCSLLASAGLFLGGLPVVAQTPTLQAEMTGRVALRVLPGAPPLEWRVQLRPSVGGIAPVGATFAAPGLAVEAEVTFPAANRPGTWRVVNGAVNLAEWARPALTMAGTGFPPDLDVVGTVLLGGSGTWQGAEFDGMLTVALRKGSVCSGAQDWEVRGLTMDALFAVQSSGVVLQTLRVTAGTLRAAGVTGSAFTADVTGRPDGDVEVRQAEFAVFGGRMALSPFTVDLAHPNVCVTAELAGLALAELAQLVPAALTDAQGRINGRISVSWSPAAGFQPGAGTLTVSAGTPAALRLAAAPGFLTQHLPERIALLPSWLGAPSRWFAPVNPAYATLQRIELGQQPLTVEKLHVGLYPDGADGPRSAVVEIVARPAAGGVVEQVSFTVNVAGPLQQVLQLGLDGRARLNFSTGK